MAVMRTTHRRLRYGGSVATAAALALGIGAALPAAAADEPAPTGFIENAGAPDAIDDSYIVVLADSVEAGSPEADALAGTYDADITSTYDAVLNGYAIEASATDAAQLAADPAVEAVVQNTTYTITETQANPPSWGLDRIDQPELPLDDSYTYPDHGGSGVTVYVIDTGVRYTHQDFGGRATMGFDTFGGDGTDGNGHGTHVASTAAGTSYGVAKDADIVGVKVLNDSGSGTLQGVIDGINWVTQNASGPSVANMSLGGSANTALDDAVRDSVAAGITYAVAAGNDNSDASGTSPARVAEAITVAASTSGDARASFSNYGSTVQIFAPGQSITAAWNSSDTATNTISGTSMASPHAAGGAALILGDDPTLTPAQVWSTMDALAVTGQISNPSGAPNKLLQVPGGSSTPRPIADIAYSCDDATLTCDFDGTGSSSGGGAITGYDWGFGDGASGTGGTTSHTYGTDGSYTVTLTVTDSTGATGSTSVEVTVGTPSEEGPTAAISGSCTSFWIWWYCELDGSGSTAGDAAITSWDWDFGDGSTGSGQTTTHWYNSGTYTITLTVTDANGLSDTATATADLS